MFDTFKLFLNFFFYFNEFHATTLAMLLGPFYHLISLLLGNLFNFLEVDVLRLAQIVYVDTLAFPFKFDMLWKLLRLLRLLFIDHPFVMISSFLID